MSQLINFTEYQPPREMRLLPLPEAPISPAVEISVDKFQQTLNILIHNHPDKVTFSLKEASSLINVSSEFLRRRVKSGMIRVMYFGDKPMIHICELARLLTEGIQ
jgi:hypothetical protein